MHHRVAFLNFLRFILSFFFAFFVSNYCTIMWWALRDSSQRNLYFILTLPYFWTVFSIHGYPNIFFSCPIRICSFCSFSRNTLVYIGLNYIPGNFASMHIMLAVCRQTVHESRIQSWDRPVYRVASVSIARIMEKNDIIAKPLLFNVYYCASNVFEIKEKIGENWRSSRAIYTCRITEQNGEITAGVISRHGWPAPFQIRLKGCLHVTALLKTRVLSKTLRQANMVYSFGLLCS